MSVSVLREEDSGIGEAVKVEPITEMKDIRSIKKMLRSNPRDYLLFIMGINSGLRVQDMLKLKIRDVKDHPVGSRISMKEGKTGKENVLMMNEAIKEALDAYLKSGEHDPDDFLFRSRKGRNAPLTTYAVMHYIKGWCAAINMKENVGAHTLRKTFCYHQRKTFGVSWEVLAKRLNHSSPSITRRYLGVKEEEVEEILMHTI